MGHGRLLPRSGVGRPHRQQLMLTAFQDQRVSGLAGTASTDEGVGEAAEAALAAAWATDACCRVAGWGGHTADSPCSQTLRISACADRRGLTRPTKGWEKQQMPPRPPHGPRTHAAEERGGVHGADSSCSQLPKTSA